MEFSFIDDRVIFVLYHESIVSGTEEDWKETEDNIFYIDEERTGGV
ncbi:MAG: hypothetical protein Q4C53_04980 [Clostridia bacterium]|nr:hypothetical protein [Clostridia bacterium]